MQRRRTIAAAAVADAQGQGRSASDHGQAKLPSTALVNDRVERGMGKFSEAVGGRVVEQQIRVFTVFKHDLHAVVRLQVVDIGAYGIQPP